MSELSKPAKRRLIQLAQLLSQTDKAVITSVELEKITGWSNAIIRRDISALGAKCGASNGYKVKLLLEAINSALKLDTTGSRKNCCIIGLGKLGLALLENSQLTGTAFSIVAGFDSSVNRVEVIRSSFPLYPTSQLEQIVAQKHIDYAVITVPEAEAQTVAARLATCGIKGIVNCTAAVLQLPPSVRCENMSLLTTLANLAADRQ